MIHGRWRRAEKIGRRPKQQQLDRKRDSKLPSIAVAGSVSRCGSERTNLRRSAGGNARAPNTGPRGFDPGGPSNRLSRDRVGADESAMRSPRWSIFPTDTAVRKFQLLPDRFSICGSRNSAHFSRATNIGTVTCFWWFVALTPRPISPGAAPAVIDPHLETIPDIRRSEMRIGFREARGILDRRLEKRDKAGPPRSRTRAL